MRVFNFSKKKSSFEDVIPESLVLWSTRSLIFMSLFLSVLFQKKYKMNPTYFSSIFYLLYILFDFNGATFAHFSDKLFCVHSSNFSLFHFLLRKHLLVYSSCNGCGGARLILRIKSSILIFLSGWQESSHMDHHHCLTRCSLEGSWTQTQVFRCGMRAS